MKLSKVLLVVVVALFTITLFTGVALAADDKPKVKERSLGDNIMASMPVGAVIILISIAAMGLVIEHFVNIRRDKIIPPEVVSELEILFDDEDWEGAIQFCETTPNFITSVVGHALPRMGAGFDAMRDAAQEAGDEEALRLQAKISYLALCATVGPMLGLFGTVTGMVGAFNVIATKTGGANPQDLADGISQALMTTVMGLMVAIPSSAFYFFFKNKVAKLVVEAGIICSELIDRFRPVEA